MKTLFILLSCVLLVHLQTNAQKPADSKATKETVQLCERMLLLREKGIMIGHQDDIVYGHSWKTTGISDVKQTTGDFPAVFGWELGDLELGNPSSLDSVSFEEIKKGIQWVYAQKGINTISWHCNNPLTGKNAWDTSSKLVVRSVLPGGEKNEIYVKMLNRLADFFLSLKDDKGVLIPVVFRPYHEHTGSWFWWGQKLCTTGDYIALWKYTVDFLKQRGVHNILYAYSSTSGMKSSAQYLERYPGDDIIDLLGFDDYQGGFNDKANYINSVKSGMAIIIPLAKERKKIPILAETGMESIPDKKWFTETLWAAIKDYSISYVLFWRNAHDKPNHYYVPFPGHAATIDFIEFMKIDRTLFMQDLQKN
jgi:mannan endo-1,4-beta-mannosidase